MSELRHVLSVDATPDTEGKYQRENSLDARMWVAVSEDAFHHSQPRRTEVGVYSLPLRDIRKHRVKSSTVLEVSK